jgi:hypothetical protein
MLLRRCSYDVVIRTLNVELHLAQSTTGGSSWSYAGQLFTTQSILNNGNASYTSGVNFLSHEVIDIYPMPYASGSQTLWVQAHLCYLVPSGPGSTYSQLEKTNYISVTAVLQTGASSASTVLSLGSAKEARLGNIGTDPSQNPTTSLSASFAAAGNCDHMDQPAWWSAGNVLYLSLQCFQTPPRVDANRLGFLVFSTQPSASSSPADPTTWTWSYGGVFATTTQAARLGAKEGTTYHLFTELQFASSTSGQLVALLNPCQVVSGGVQPVTQYGVRVFNVTSMSPPALATDVSGTPVTVASVVISDLFRTPNQGTGAATYDPASSTGIIIVRKLENDPTLGFFVSLYASGLTSWSPTSSPAGASSPPSAPTPRPASSGSVLSSGLLGSVLALALLFM